MAVQVSLLDDRIPMKAAENLTLPDPTTAIAKGMTMRGNMVKEKEVEREIGEQNDDRAQLQQYLQSGGDLHTPPGLYKALDDLKGKVSPDLYSKLATHADDVRNKEAKYKDDLTKMTADQLALTGQQTEGMLTALAMPLDVYTKTKSEKGEAEASAQFQDTRSKVVAQLGAQKGPDGKPLYPPEQLAQIAQADPTTLGAMVAGTKYHAAQIKAKLEEAQTAHAQSEAHLDDVRSKVYEGGGTLQGGATEIAKIRRDIANGVVTPDQGEKMIAGIVAKKSAPAEVSGLTPEAVDQAATAYYLDHSLPSRLSPAERTKILNRAAEVAKENGDDADAAAIRVQTNKAGKLALNDISKRSALIDTYEKDADKRLSLVTELAHKTDQNNVPAINRWVNAGRKEIEGDADVNNFNSAMISAQAELARILSGALTNAATSDSARAEAAAIINKNMSIDQIDSLIPNIRRELKFKKDSFDSQKKEIVDSMRTPNSKAAHDVIDKDTQEKRDSDAGVILKKELADERKRLASMDPKDPEQADAITRKKGDIDAILREMKKTKIKDDGDAAVAAKPKSGDHPPAIQSLLEKYK